MADEGGVNFRVADGHKVIVRQSGSADHDRLDNLDKLDRRQ